MERQRSFVAECYWPDVREQDVLEVDARIRASAAQGVRYLGSMLIREDEIVLFQFEGTAEAVRAVAETTGVPFERLLETTISRTKERAQ